MAVVGVRVVVVVLVDGHETRHVVAEAGDEFGVLRDRLRFAVTADMSEKADDLPGLTHHPVQVVRDHENAERVPLVPVANQTVERQLAGEVELLRRFVENQQVGGPRLGRGSAAPRCHSPPERADSGVLSRCAHSPFSARAGTRRESALSARKPPTSMGTSRLKLNDCGT